MAYLSHADTENQIMGGSFRHFADTGLILNFVLDISCQGVYFKTLAS